MAQTESAADFLILDDFAVTAAYNTATTVTGILDRGFVNVQDVETEAPMFTCELADVSGVGHDDSLTVNGTDYTIVGVQPDESQFLVKLVLQEDDA